MLLDTAVVMMQQYSSLAAVSQQTPSTNSNTLNNLPTGQNSFSGSIPTDAPKIAKIAPTTSSQVNSTTTESTPDENTLDKPSTSKSVVQEEINVTISPEEEIRRRRLQKFQQTATENAQE